VATVSIRNISEGPRGVYNADGGLVMIEKGETAELDISAAERKDAEASGYFLFGDAAEADPNDLNALKKADLLAIAEAEGVAIETDDNRSDLIRKIEEARATASA
jgi:hypothetical protein